MPVPQHRDHQGICLIQPDQTSAVKTSASATAQVSSEMRQPDFCMALCARVRASSETISGSAIGVMFALLPFLPPENKKARSSVLGPASGRFLGLLLLKGPS